VVSALADGKFQTNLQHKRADSDGESTDAERLNSRHAHDQVIVITLVLPPTACPHFHTRWVMRAYQRRADTADQL
jgi:hypothetical protein